MSVIIPVYNSEKYIYRCLDSVINQTLIELEIICVDDYSSDDSRIILEKYAGIDKRIKILYNDKNMGQAFSRNRAIETAEGEYIQFLDSDDYLAREEALDVLYSVSFRGNLDLLKSEWFIVNNQAMKKQIQYPENIVEKICSGKELLYKLEFYNICARTTVSNFVRRKFLFENNISFYNNIIHEDILYSYDLYYYAERAMCINQCIYCYVKHENSTTTRQKDIGHLNGHLVCMNEIIKKNFMCASIGFRYATIKYLVRIYNEIVNLRKELHHCLTPEMINSEIRELYNLFWGKEDINYISRETVIKNVNTIIQSERLYIYGAGKAARELINILAGFDMSIDGVYVTNIENSAKTILGHKVLGIDTYVPSDKSTMFLVAITKKYVGNTIDLLRSKGIENIIYVC